MSPKVKLLLGAVFSAAINTAVALLRPEYQPAALAFAGFVLGALGVKRPGDVAPEKPQEVGK
jgi:hypothetical protein